MNLENIRLSKRSQTPKTMYNIILSNECLDQERRYPQRKEISRLPRTREWQEWEVTASEYEVLFLKLQFFGNFTQCNLIIFTLNSSHI